MGRPRSTRLARTTGGVDRSAGVDRRHLACPAPAVRWRPAVRPRPREVVKIPPTRSEPGGAGGTPAVHTPRANNRRRRSQRGRGPQASCLPCVGGPMAASVPAKTARGGEPQHTPCEPGRAGGTPALPGRANGRRGHPGPSVHRVDGDHHAPPPARYRPHPASSPAKSLPPTTPSPSRSAIGSLPPHCESSTARSAPPTTPSRSRSARLHPARS